MDPPWYTLPTTAGGFKESSSDLKDKHVEVFTRAIKEKGFLSYHMVQCLPFGPPCVGKTCLYHCLLDKPPPGTPSTLNKPGSMSESTNVLTGRRMIQVKIDLDSHRHSPEVVIAEDGSWKEVSSLHDEIAIYLKSIECQLQPQSIAVSQPAVTELDDAVVKAITEHVSGRNVDINKVQALLDKSMIIFYTDTGGQPEFHEVLPALVAGPSIFLLVFNLAEPLNSLYRVIYESDSKKYEYDSSFSVSEVLMQCFSSISSYHNAQLQDFSKQKSYIQKYIEQRQPPTCVLVVGTHSDLVSSEDVVEVDEELKTGFGENGIVEYYRSNSLLIPVNNYGPKDGSKVREVFDRVVKRKKEGISPYKIQIPVHWLGVELYLRQKKSPTISLSECKEIGRKFNMQEEELISCLWFLHYKTGTIRHYSSVNELKDTVIIEPSIIFIAVTEFITSTFTLEHVNAQVHDDFKSLGLFKSKDVKSIFNQHEQRLGITYSQFIALLSHLNILVPAHDSNFDFFLPCALVHALESDREVTVVTSEELFILFKEGFVPKGIFSGLLGILIKAGWKITYNNDHQPLLFRNKAVLSFTMKGCKYPIDCTITTTSAYIQLKIEKFEQEVELSILYSFVVKVLKQSLDEVCSVLQYEKFWEFGIICKHANYDSKGLHFAKIDEKEQTATCTKLKRSYLLKYGDNCWFNKSNTVSTPFYSQVIIKCQQIENCTNEPEYNRAKGIIFVVGIFGADGTAIDVKNVESTFKDLNFAVYIEQDPTSKQIALLMEAAAECTYPTRYEYIAFYFSGHGGRDQAGKLFVKGLQPNKSNPEVLHIEEFIIEPLKGLDKFIRLCFFDCCQTIGNGTPFHDEDDKKIQNPNPHPGILIAYSTSDGQKSFDDRTNGGIWTYLLCKNLREAQTLQEVLCKTFDDVAKIRKQFQEPTTICSDEVLQIVLNQESSDLEDKHAEVFTRAIREKGSLSYHMVQCLPFGPPRVGKTCLYNCLLDKPPPGTPSTLNEPGSGSESTKVLTGRRMIQENVDLDSLRHSAEMVIAEDGSWKEVSSLHDQIAIYLKSMEHQCKHQSIAVSNYDPLSSSKDIFDEHHETEHNETEIVPEEIFDEHHKNVYVPVEKPVPSKNDDSCTPIQTAGILSLEITENFSKLSQPAVAELDDTVVKAITEYVTGRNVDMSTVQALLDKSMTIFYTDTGGQPEFHEVLPALVAGPSIFLLVFSLAEPLNSLYKVIFESATEKYEMYDSSFSVSEVLMQCFSSISSYHNAQLRDFSKKKSDVQKYIKLRHPPTCAVLVIGTHSDLVSSEDIKAVDEELKTRFGNRSIVEHYKPNALLIPVNNYEPKDGSKVRKVVDRVVKRKKEGTSPYEIKIPVHWLGVELYLRQKNVPTISLSECKEIGRKFNMQEEELVSCLWFLHYKTGTIRHYSSVSELKDTVIIEPSIIFNAVTEFITSTFTLKHVDAQVHDDFKSLGLFKSKYVKFIFNQHEQRLGITYSQFTALLSHLNILVPAHDSNFDFFLPCALVHALESDREITVLTRELLFIIFKEGFVPKGIFSGLLGILIKAGWIITHNDDQPQLFRNKAVLFFTMKGKYSFDCTITTTSTYIKLKIEKLEQKVELSILYSYVVKVLKQSLDEVCSILQYGKIWEFGIICKHASCDSKGLHFAKIDEKEQTATCKKSKRSYEFNDEDSFWFNKSNTVETPFYSQVIIKRQQIENCTNEPEYNRAKGIIFVVVIFGADGTAIDFKNVESTFKDLNFAVYIERDPTSEQIALLMKAAAECTYPTRYKYIAFYFAGHGGRDQAGKLFVKGLQPNKSNPEVLYIEEFIIEPLKGLDKFIRLCFFDCCQTIDNGTPFCDEDDKKIQNPNPQPGILIAYSTSNGQKSFDDRTNGGIWTYFLCKNLREGQTLEEVLCKTFDDVAKIRKQFQKPTTICSDEVLQIVLNQADSVAIETVISSEIELTKSSTNSPVSSRDSSSSESETQDKASKLPCVPDDSILSYDGDTVLAVLMATHHITEWSILALLLGLSPADVNHIQSTTEDSKRMKMSIISKWIESGTASWAVLVTALNHSMIGQGAVAVDIAKKHPKSLYTDACNSESILLKTLEVKDVYDLTVSQSSRWNDLGRELKLSLDFRNQLRNDIRLYDKDRLEMVLQKWIESSPVPVTWSTLIEALEAIELKIVANKVKEFLKNSKAKKLYK